MVVRGTFRADAWHCEKKRQKKTLGRSGPSLSGSPSPAVPFLPGPSGVLEPRVRSPGSPGAVRHVRTYVRWDTANAKASSPQPTPKLLRELATTIRQSQRHPLSPSAAVAAQAMVVRPHVRTCVGSPAGPQPTRARWRCPPSVRSRTHRTALTSAGKSVRCDCIPTSSASILAIEGARACFPITCTKWPTIA